jgi:ATP/maltotriose-dependent transcriptional regulator MalT
MKTILAAILSLIVGVGIGWYAGYTHAIAKANRGFLSKTGFSEESVRQFLNECKIINETIIDSDESAALNSLAVLLWLSNGDQDRAKTALLRPIRRFYVKYGSANDTSKTITPSQHELLIRIEKFASHDEAFRRAISSTNEDTTGPTTKSTVP